MTNREGFSTIAPAEYAPAANYANAPTGAAYHYTPVMAAPAGEYDQAVSFNVTSDNSGAITIYAYADTTDYGLQTATIVNGFQLGLVPGGTSPEPASLSILGLGALAMVRRRRD